MIKVLVVDDSPLMVRMLSDIINTVPDLRVVGAAFHGYDAVKKVNSLAPDVITMDVNMPRMDGLKAVEHIMSTIPTPIVMISSLTQEGAAITMQALELGAIDFVSKPSGYVSLDIEDLADEIIAKIRMAAKIRVVRTVRRASAAPVSESKKSSKDGTKKTSSYLFARSELPKHAHNYRRVVAIGCSTGGPLALHVILTQLPAHFPAPILVAQHMPEKFTEKLAEFLNQRAPLHVVEAREGMKIQRGVVYVAPGGFHACVRANRTISLFRGELEASIPCPSVDILMESVAKIYGNRSIGVILTGMGNDGAVGVKAIKEQQGMTLSQDEATSLVFGMPHVAIESGYIDAVVPLSEMAEEIMRRVPPGNTIQQTETEKTG